MRSAGSNLPPPDLPTVRRYEAGGFRAWPAASVHYDGTWVIRLTPGHAAKRLNSVNPLDPRDTADIAGRIEAARRLFADAGRDFTFRLSPLSGPFLESHLGREGWSAFSESLVMEVDITPDLIENATDRIPMRDIVRFMASARKVHGMKADAADGLAAVIASVKANVGLFVVNREDDPLTTLVCVQDGPIAGLFEVATAEAERGMGHGRRAILSALRWARLGGARKGWLQVEADNAIAVGLYRKLGFREVYRYRYRRPPSP